MLARKNFENEDKALDLPTEWSLKVTNLLHSLYEDELNKLSQTFEVYGQTFEDEILIGTCLLSNQDLPVSYVVSCDLTAKDDPSVILSTLIDSIGFFFDSYFANVEEFDEYNADWTETKFKDLNFYYQVSRENIGLSLEANKLLRGH